MARKKTDAYTLIGRGPKITSIHATIEPGSKMPQEVRNRILTKVQARAFLRGYIDYLQAMTEEEQTDIERNAIYLTIQVLTGKLESIN